MQPKFALPPLAKMHKTLVSDLNFYPPEKALIKAFEHFMQMEQI